MIPIMRKYSLDSLAEHELIFLFNSFPHLRAQFQSFQQQLYATNTNRPVGTSANVNTNQMTGPGYYGPNK